MMNSIVFKSVAIPRFITRLILIISLPRIGPSLFCYNFHCGHGHRNYGRTLLITLEAEIILQTVRNVISVLRNSRRWSFLGHRL